MNKYDSAENGDAARGGGQAFGRGGEPRGDSRSILVTAGDIFNSSNCGLRVESPMSLISAYARALLRELSGPPPPPPAPMRDSHTITLSPSFPSRSAAKPPRFFLTPAFSPPSLHPCPPASPPPPSSLRRSAFLFPRRVSAPSRAARELRFSGGRGGMVLDETFSFSVSLSFSLSLVEKPFLGRSAPSRRSTRAKSRGRSQSFLGFPRAR